MQTVYLDILFLTNWIIDYLLLLVTAGFAGRPFRRRRLALAAALGALLAIPAFFWPLEGGTALLAKGLLCAGLCALAFETLDPRQLLRLGLILLAVTLAFGGAALALAAMTAGRELIHIQGGAAYIDLPLGTLLLSTGAAYCLLSLVFSCAGARRKGSFVQISVSLGGREARLKALRDTGNLLRDPVTTKRVIVAEKKRLWPLFSPEERRALEGLDAGNAAQVFQKLGQEGGRRFLLAPYQAVGQPGALLLTLRPDRVTLDGQPSQDYLIGLSPSLLGLPEGACAIIG